MAENQKLKHRVFLWVTVVNSQTWHLFLSQGVLSQQRSWQSPPAGGVSEKVCMWCNPLTVPKGQTSNSGEPYINLSWNLVPSSMKDTTCAEKSHLQRDFSWYMFKEERIVLLLYSGSWRLSSQGAWRSLWIMREMKMISHSSSPYACPWEAWEIGSLLQKLIIPLHILYPLYAHLCAATLTLQGFW